ncbi:hypothetical protein M9H77_04013 [Catharanthus roseus]|uniref:Uncharacterized protein n=1 Tax=Catharanthus roseus TaxID=4058 RepID=A0ACC0CD40_CATRO|nr:hypothetical protein M9H77_04013 [Catharanthus roseus]
MRGRRYCTITSEDRGAGPAVTNALRTLLIAGVASTGTSLAAVSSPTSYCVPASAASSQSSTGFSSAVPACFGPPIGISHQLDAFTGNMTIFLQWVQTDGYAMEEEEEDIWLVLAVAKVWSARVVAKAMPSLLYSSARARFRCCSSLQIWEELFLFLAWVLIESDGSELYHKLHYLNP